MSCRCLWWFSFGLQNGKQKPSEVHTQNMIGMMDGEQFNWDVISDYFNGLMLYADVVPRPDPACRKGGL